MLKKKWVWAVLLLLVILLTGCIEEIHTALNDGTRDGMQQCHLPEDEMPPYYLPPSRSGNPPEYAGDWVKTNYSVAFSWSDPTWGDSYVMISLPALDPRVKAGDAYNAEVLGYAMELLNDISDWSGSRKITELESVSFHTELSNGELTVKIVEFWEDRTEVVHVARFDVQTQKRVY